MSEEKEQKVKNTPKDIEAEKPEKSEGKKEEKKEKVEREKKEKVERERAPKTGRVIVRNLGFDIGQKHLQSMFSKFGEIVEINIPSKTGNEKLNRGFGFIEYTSKEHAEKAITELNNSQWKGRTITVHFSVPKGSYDHRLDSMVEHTKLDRSAAALPKTLRDEKDAKQEVIDKKK